MGNPLSTEECRKVAAEFSDRAKSASSAFLRRYYQRVVKRYLLLAEGDLRSAQHCRDRGKWRTTRKIELITNLKRPRTSGEFPTVPRADEIWWGPLHRGGIQQRRRSDLWVVATVWRCWHSARQKRLAIVGCT